MATSSNVSGSWFGSTGFGMTFLKLKRNYSFEWHYHSCTVKDGYFEGTYKLSSDSLLLKSEEENILLFLVNGRLVTLPYENPQLVDSKTGMGKTLRRTKFGANQKWRHEQNKRRRERSKNQQL